MTDKTTEAEFIATAAQLATKLGQFIRMYAGELKASREQVAFAVALYCVNARETYVDTDGSVNPQAFDRVARRAAQYFDANAKDVK